MDPFAATPLDRALADLTELQRAAVESPARALCILAGAGSGKTRVLTLRVARRIRDGSAEADHSVVCTFTRRAARELTERLRGYGIPVSAPATTARPPQPGVRAGTLHQLALSLLRRRALDAGRPPPALCSERYRIVSELAGEPALASALSTEIGWAKARGIGPEGYADEAESCGRTVAVAPDQVESAFVAYQQALGRRRAVDLDDLLGLAADAIEEDSDFAGAVHWRYRTLAVDEFQDVNPVQFRLVRAVSGADADLCAVGDPNQAIYGWNGAEPSLIEELPRVIAGMEVVRLDENHRSTPQVVSAAVEALGRAVSPAPRSAAPDGPVPVVTAYDDEEAEADGVASILLDRSAEGGRWSDHAVLARTNEQLGHIRRALTRVGIPYRLAARDPETNADADAVAAPDAEGLAVASLESAVVERPPAGGAVELASFHRAKGLEWGTVFVVGLEDGYVPIVYATDERALAEERRLLYVALTRARRELYCSWARLRRTGSGVSREREPCPWLAGVERVSTAGTGMPSAGHAVRRIADLRAALRR